MDRRAFIATVSYAGAGTSVFGVAFQVSDPALLGRKRGGGMTCDITISGFTSGGDSFDCYTVETDPVAGTLNSGTGFTGAWITPGRTVGVQGTETFETYSTGDVLVPLNGPWGFASAWVLPGRYNLSVGYDTFETYAVEDPIVSTLSGGTLLSGSWVFGF